MKLENIFYISEDNWYKLQAWASLAYDKDKNEISGLMTAVPQKDGRFELSNVEILKQVNSGHNTELDKDSVTEYTMKYGMKYNNPKMKFVWWHSHHTMGAFWSGTDEKEINAWQNSSFSLALVVNLKEEYKFRVSIWQAGALPVEQHYDTSLTIERTQPKILVTETMKKQYDKLCSEEQQIVRNGWGNYVHREQMLIGEGSIISNNHLSIESAYQQAFEKIENMQDAYVSGEINFSAWKKGIKKINKICKKEKLPFIVIDWKFGKNQLLDLLMTKEPAELFQWDDNQLQNRIETINWNNSFGGGFTY